MTINVTEIFGPTISGEGMWAGQKTSFLRLAYCTYRCSWCDSMHAVDPGREDFVSKKMTEDEIVTELDKLNCKTLTISGGNPAMQDLGHLLYRLNRSGYLCSMETQGDISKEWMNQLDLLTLSPKPPSSLMKTNWDKLTECVSIMKQKQDINGDSIDCQLKVVVNIDYPGDMEYAKEVHNKYLGIPFYISIWTDVNKDTRDTLLDRYKRTAEVVTNDPDWKDVHVLPQLHVLLWSHAKGV